MPDTVIRVLVVDDHPLVRAGIAATITYQDDMQVIGQASNGAEALELFLRERPDIILMDLRMPVMDGVQAIVAIRNEAPRARIIVLTTYDGDDDIFKAMRAGATGYMLKDSSVAELIGAIHTVHQGKKYLPTGLSEKLAERVSSAQLSTRELEVLGLIAKGRTNLEIATTLFIVEGTVKAHVTNILTKLNVSDRTHAVTEALRRGILHLG